MRKTVYTFIILICASWLLEVGIGIVIIRWYWGTAWYAGGNVSLQSMAAVIASAGVLIASAIHAINGHYAIGATYQLIDPHWSESGVVLALIVLYLAIHVIFVFWGLLAPPLDRWHLGVRNPSQREQERFERAYSVIARNRYESISRPRRWVVVDGMGLQMRWIGYVLVVDRELLTHRFFTALLAHQLGHTNSEDRLAHRLYAMLPPTAALCGVFGGMPFALGHVLLYPFWAWYWRNRIYSADAFAVSLNQGHALLQVLDSLYLRLDQTTRGGRGLKRVPYIEQRIHRLTEEMLRQVVN